MKDISFNLEIEPDGKILDKIQIIGRSRRILGNIIDYIAFTIIICGVILATCFISPDFAYSFPIRLAEILGYPLWMWSDKLGDWYNVDVWFILFMSLYYLMCELTLGASLGKWICGGILLEKNGERIDDKSVIWRRFFQTICVIGAYTILFHCVSDLKGGIFFLIFLRLLCNGTSILITKKSLHEPLDDYHYYNRKNWKQLFPEKDYAHLEMPHPSPVIEEKTCDSAGAHLNTPQDCDSKIDISHEEKEVFQQEIPTKTYSEQKKVLSRKEKLLAKYLFLCLLVGLIWLAIQQYGRYTGMLQMDDTWKNTVLHLLCTNICAIILLLILYFRNKHSTNYDFLLPAPLSNYFNRETCSDIEKRSIMLSIIFPLYAIAPIPAIGYYALLYIVTFIVLVIIIFEVRDILSWIHGSKKKWKNVILVSYIIFFSSRFFLFFCYALKKIIYN